MNNVEKETIPRIAFVKPLEANYLYETCTTELAELLDSSNCHTGPLAFFTDYNTDNYLIKLPASPECQTWTEGPHMGINGQKVVRQRKLLARQNKKQLELYSVDKINWSDYQAVVSIGCAIPSRIIKQYPHTVWCYYIPDPSPAFLFSKLWGPLHGYNVFFTQGISSTVPSSDQLELYRNTHRTILNIPFVFMRPDTFTNLFPAIKREGIRIESRSMEDATPDIIEKLKEFGTISKRVESVKDYIEQLSSTRYFIILDTPHERFRGNALVEANAAGCLIIAPEKIRSLNGHLIPGQNRYKDYTDLFNKLTHLNKSEQLRTEMLQHQNSIIAEASYIAPKSSFDQILKLHPQSRASNKPNKWKQRYFPTICTKLMSLFGVINTITAKLTGKPFFEILTKIVNRKGDMF